MTTLPFDQTVKYDLIIGLADIHIKNHVNDRQKSRYDEYRKTFEYLIEQLKQLTTNRHPLIIICGDLFDVKDRLTSYGIRLFNQLIKQLSEIAPLIIFKGNHDYVAVEGKESDLIDCFMDNSKSNVCYLSRTGHYLLNNLSFSYIDILDLIKTGSTCDKVDRLPPFPEHFTDPNSPNAPLTKIGLLHGTLIGSSLTKHRSINTGYPMEWVENSGHDYVIMGDNHTQQILGHHHQMCYCSSLIQQNFGESFIDGHGFMTLDLKRHLLIPYTVTCPTGQVYLSYRDQMWVNYKTNQFLSEMITHPNCPSTWIISIRGTTTPEQIEDLIAHLRNQSIECRMVREMINLCEAIIPSSQVTEFPQEIGDLSRYNCPNYWKEFIHDHQADLLLDFIDNPQVLLISGNPTHDFLKKFNQDMGQLITEYQKNIVSTLKPKRSLFRLREASWSWLFSYGANNSFHFDKYQGSLTNISGCNSSGKSAMTEIIAIGLFGLTGIPSRHVGSQDSTAILHRFKPSDQHASVTVEFSLDNTIYKVVRVFDRHKDKMTTLECHLEGVQKFNIRIFMP